MPNYAKFNIYSSSAGSGKTFTLTREFLRLSLRTDQDFYYKRILAITFTNDAATEMKERIMAALQEFASDDFNEKSKYWTMAQMILDEEIDLNIHTLKFRAKAVFYKIIQEYAEFSVKTIDSFVNQLVSAFSEDLDLPFNYEIVLDKDLVLTEAVERLIEKAGSAEYDDISKILEDFALTKAEDGKNWNQLPDELAKFGTNQLNDLYYSAISSLDNLELRDFRKIQAQLIEYLKAIENQVISLAKKATQIIDNQTLSINDFAYKGSGIGAYFYNIRENFEEKFTDEPNSYQWKAINEDAWYTKKSTTIPNPIQTSIDEIAEDLRLIFLDIQTLREKNLAKFLLYKNILLNFHKLSLLSKIKVEFDDVLREKNQVFISEFNRKILHVVLSEPVPFIYEKIGEKYNHLLIDEFQDTSEMQFYNLLPLIENSLAKNHFNLIVGDAKQSIYRWRGGNMGLLVYLFKKDVKSLISNNLGSEFQLEQYQSIQPYLNPLSLNTNRRSTKEVVEFNNDFFKTITEIESPIYPFLVQVYDETFQQKLPDNPKNGGHIEIDFLEKGAEISMLERIQSIVETALSEGFQLRDIAILTRSNKNSSLVANFLKDLGYEIISRDSLLLKNSPSVRLIIAFLKVLNQPDNALAKYEAAYLFYQQILLQIPDSQQNTEISLVIESPDIQDFFQYFATKGYNFQPFALQRVAMYEMVEKIIGILGLFYRANEQHYLFRFMDLVLEFGQRQSNHLQDFLSYWEDKKGSLSVKSSGENNAITITTIHRSKGLEYPVVIVPYANWEIQPLWSNTFWGDLSNTSNKEFSELNRLFENKAPKKLNASPFHFKNDLAKTPVGEQYLAEKQAYFLENLNMLYVAFTRSVDKLYVLSEKTTKNKKSSFKGIGELLKKYLEAKEIFNENENFYVLNSYKRQEENKATKIEIAPETILLDKIISEDRSDKLRLRRISEKIFDAQTLDKSKDRGNKVHAAFEQIKTRDEVNEVIRQLLSEGIFSKDEAIEIKMSITKVISLPQLAPLFESNLEILTEKEILTPDGKMQRPDRVVLKDGIAYIIDYKTGLPKESHETQIRHYGQLYQQMGYPKVKMMLVYLENLKVLEVEC